VVRCGSAVQEAGARVEKISINVDKPSMMETPFNLTPPVVLMKGENNPAFLISWRSQKDLVRRLAWKSAAMIWCSTRSNGSPGWISRRTADARFARQHLLPWIGRRLTGRSSGDGLLPKRPELHPYEEPPA